MDLTSLTISQAHRGLKKKDFSVFELCLAYLKRIKKEDKNISAFLSIIDEDLIFSQAKKIDALILKGEKISFLAGIPLAVKDNILVEGVRCTAGSKMLQNYIAPYDATAIKKLKSENAIILGKTNLDEFAMGSSTENSFFGPTKNPHDLTLVPGGSSGGSTAAVAARLAFFALGSDTGGSIRQPCSFCGAVGLKPTYGAVSRYGLIAFASSLDQIGPITKTVEDCQIVFDAIRGRDEMDSTSVDGSYGNRLRGPSRGCATNKGNRNGSCSQKTLNELKIGVPKEYFIKGIDPQVEKAIKKAIKSYQEMGAEIKEISLPHTEYALACYYIISSSEASANLARYDGIKFGYSSAKEETLLAMYLESRGKGFGEEVKRRIMIGTFALSAGYYQAYYLRAQKARALVRDDFERAFKGVDVIFTPVSPFLPFKIGERIKDPLAMYLSDAYTVSVNLAGLPALSLPCGKAGELPVGLQIIGRPFEEDKILQIGKLYKENGNN